VAIAADCKSVVVRHRWFESIHPHNIDIKNKRE
jgi:GTP cyclohydrolase FolE2